MSLILKSFILIILIFVSGYNFYVDGLLTYQWYTLLPTRRNEAVTRIIVYIPQVLQICSYALSGLRLSVVLINVSMPNSPLSRLLISVCITVGTFDIITDWLFTSSILSVGTFVSYFIQYTILSECTIIVALALLISLVHPKY